MSAIVRKKVQEFEIFVPLQIVHDEEWRFEIMFALVGEMFCMVVEDRFHIFPNTYWKVV